MILWYVQEALNSVLITYFSLCRFHKYFLPYIVEISLKLSLSRSFSCRGRNMMNEDRCEWHWSGVVCPVILKRKAWLKFSLCRIHVLWGFKIYQIIWVIKFNSKIHKNGAFWLLTCCLNACCLFEEKRVKSTNVGQEHRSTSVQ